jgi:hypothetical protein
MEHLQRNAFAVAMGRGVDGRHSAQTEQFVEAPPFAQDLTQAAFGAAKLIFVPRFARCRPVDGTTTSLTGHTYLVAGRHISKSIESPEAHRI